MTEEVKENCPYCGSLRLDVCGTPLTGQAVFACGTIYYGRNCDTRGSSCIIRARAADAQTIAALREKVARLEGDLKELREAAHSVLAGGRKFGPRKVWNVLQAALTKGDDRAE